jgi:hypothetical protein
MCTSLLADSDLLDASVLVMPLVFFMAPTGAPLPRSEHEVSSEFPFCSDPRFISTLDAILQTVAKGARCLGACIVISASHCFLIRRRLGVEQPCLSLQREAHGG